MFSGVGCFTEAIFSKSAYFKEAVFSQDIDFIEARFDGVSNFNRTKFESTAFFKKTTFNNAPCFHNVDLHQDTSFHRAKCTHKTGNEDDARAWRTLKLAMNKIHNHEQEMVFFRYEMEAEREVQKKDKRYVNLFLITFYKWVSEYGTSISKPLCWLILSWLLFGVFYSFECCNEDVLSLTTQVKDYCFKGYQLSAATMLPFVSSSKATISTMLGSGMDGVFQFVTIVQSLISLVLLFLTGLALKHKFSIK